MCQEEESHLCWRKVCGKHTKCILGGFIADIERWKYSPRGEMCFKHRVYKLYILPTKLVNSHFFWHLFHTVNIWEGSMGSALWQLSLFPHFLLTFATTRGVLAHTRTSSTQLESGLSGMMWHWFPAPCPSDPSDVGALIKVSLRACFYEEDLLSISAFEWDISRVKSWSRRACVRVRACVRDSSGGGGGVIEWRRKRDVPRSSESLPSCARVREAAESQSSHFYQVKLLEAPLACLVKG